MKDDTDANPNWSWDSYYRDVRIWGAIFAGIILAIAATVFTFGRWP